MTTTEYLVSNNFSNMTKDNIYSIIPPADSLQIANSSHEMVPVNIPSSKYQKLLLGYTLTSIIIITAILNLLVVCILTRSNMRSAVNVILSALAVSDSLTGLSALPYYISVHVINRKTSFIPYELCYVQKLCSGILPTIFHTISVWLTLTLAVQRYIFLCHPLRAKSLCTITRMVNVAIAISLSSFLIHSPRLFDSTFVKMTMYVDGEEIITCAEVLQDWTREIQNIYYPVYYWSRLLGIHLIPSVSLIIFNITLIHVMRTTNRRRRLLIIQNRTNEWRRLRETNNTTLLLIIVVSIFLIVELPLGSFMILGVIENQLGKELLNHEMKDVLSLAFNFLVSLSYPLNFFLYVIMSKKFRKQVSDVMCRSSSSRDSTLTLQTSREKSSSIELMKSIFTVMAVPSGLTSRKQRKSLSKSSISASSSISGQQMVQNKSESQQKLTCSSSEDKTSAGCCECTCIYCVESCYKPKTYVNVATYANEILNNEERTIIPRVSSAKSWHYNQI